MQHHVTFTVLIIFAAALVLVRGCKSEPSQGCQKKESLPVALAAFNYKIQEVRLNWKWIIGSACPVSLRTT